MKIYVYPADAHGCGHYRLIWPARELIRRGHDVVLSMPEERQITARYEGDEVLEVFIPSDADVIVLQRPTHQFLAKSIPLIRAKGVAVVVDMDDDLSRVHPHNPAWQMMHPDASLKFSSHSRQHSWAWCEVACDAATFVTASTPALRARYGRHGRFSVIRNCVPESFFQIPHVDSDVVGWPASLGSHPDDPSVVGGGISRALDELSQPLTVISEATGVARAFGLGSSDRVNPLGSVTLEQWPHTVTRLGVALAPLADTQFNAAKSWLKPLECAALGVPCVMSPRVEYCEINRLGVGLLARKPNEWYRYVTRLARNADVRHDIAAKSQAAVRHLTYEERADEWLTAWTYAWELQRN